MLLVTIRIAVLLLPGALYTFVCFLIILFVALSVGRLGENCGWVCVRIFVCNCVYVVVVVVVVMVVLAAILVSVLVVVR